MLLCSDTWKCCCVLRVQLRLQLQRLPKQLVVVADCRFCKRNLDGEELSERMAASSDERAISALDSDQSIKVVFADCANDDVDRITFRPNHRRLCSLRKACASARQTKLRHKWRKTQRLRQPVSVDLGRQALRGGIRQPVPCLASLTVEVTLLHLLSFSDLLLAVFPWTFLCSSSTHSSMAVSFSPLLRLRLPVTLHVIFCTGSRSNSSLIFGFLSCRRSLFAFGLVPAHLPLHACELPAQQDLVRAGLP